MGSVKDIISKIKLSSDCNNVPTIFLDFDGCITHSCQAVVDILNKKYQTSFTGADVTTWDFKNCFPDMTAEKVEDIFNSKEFFDVLQPIKGAFEFMDMYRNRIYIVTKANPDNYKYKCEWLKKYGFDDIPVIGLPLNVSKSIVDMRGVLHIPTIFIDDSSQNLIQSNASVKILFHEYNDNKKREWQQSEPMILHDVYGW